MSDKITLAVRFRMDAPAKQEFIAKLQEVFAHIVKEEAFVEASLVQDMRNPESILNYEVEKMIVDPGHLWLFGGWGPTSSNGNGYLNDLWRYLPYP